MARYSITIVGFVFVIAFLSKSLFSQAVVSQQAGFVVELETAQSPVTNTFISCSMKRPAHMATYSEQIMVHRSTDYVQSWTLIDTFMPGFDSRLIDPVLTVDHSGIFYLVFMRIEKASLPLDQRSTSLDLYRSIDDGLSWQLVGSPWSGMFPDYPQLISRNKGELFLVFGDFESALVQNIKFIKSGDGGKTWTSPKHFTYPNVQQSYVGIPDISWVQDSNIRISFGSNLYKGPSTTVSGNLGVSWSSNILADQATTLANTSVLSKLLAHPRVGFYGVLSHRPHSNATTITYHYEYEGELKTTLIGTGAYAEGLLTSDSIVHVVYNEVDQDTFRIKYIASGNQGITFTQPIVLYSATFEGGEYGEYQSLIQGNDGSFYLTFCDWGDSSKAKTIVFKPLSIDFNPVLGKGETDLLDRQYTIYPNPFRESITIRYPFHAAATEIVMNTSSGRRVATFQPETQEKELILNLAALPPGLYLLRFKQGARYVVKKVVKLN